MKVNASKRKKMTTQSEKVPQSGGLCKVSESTVHMFPFFFFFLFGFSRQGLL